MEPGLKDPHRAQRELLAKIPMFAGLPARLLDELVAASRILKFQINDFLFRVDEAIREAHVLANGTVKRSTRLAGEAEKVLELVQPQQMLALGEVFGASTYSSSGQAITPCIVVAIDAGKLRAIVGQDLDLSGRIIQALSRRQHAIEFDATGYHYGLTGTQRVLDFLVQLAGERPTLAGETTVTLKTSKKMIASRIGMTPESFSRSLRLLSDSGVIVVEGRNVHIQNAALLDTELGSESQLLTFPRKPKAAAGQDDRQLSPGALINLCARPRVLSQRMAIAWSLIGRNISPARARIKLRQLRTQFEQHLERLGELGLPAPLAGRLDAVLQVWPRYRQALFDSEPEAPQAMAVLALSEEILEAIDRLAREAEHHADTPGAHYVNIAGRNRMLSQRIGKLFLILEWGLGDETAQQRLDASRHEFETNLAKLQRSGMTVPELAAQLQEVARQWRKFKAALLPDPAHGSRTRHALAVIAEGERLLRHVETAVKLYERLAK